MISDQLLEEIAKGEGEPLVRAAKRMPSSRQGKPVSLSCLLRWVLSGVRGPDDRPIRLEAVRCAGRWLTTPGAIQRWLAAQTPHLDGDPPSSPRSPSNRQRASDRAAAQLKKLGI